VETLELDTAIDELETRVERLRSLYEQYFMGIEKIAPAVAHKDVSRRIDILRREQIRNTAKRFRLQMIIQRYNTFQQYWLRILREIENGTYKRHVLRAERSMASMRVSSIPSPATSEQLVVSDVAPESEGAPASRPRKSVAPSAPRHPIPTGPRHSTLPPPEKVEAFTRALERDLAAALDGELDFGSIKGDIADVSLELDDPIPAARLPPEARKPAQAQPLRTASLAKGVVPPLRLPPQSAVGGHRLPPAAPKLPGSLPGNRALPQQSRLAPLPTAATAPVEKPSATDARSALSSDRLQEIHRQLLEAKAKTNDRAEVSLGSLSKKLEATTKQLSEKHAGKKIDFTVVIKDGKAVVKPIVR
jgi:hypothetical protein